jgi:plastocyanin
MPRKLLVHVVGPFLLGGAMAAAGSLSGFGQSQYVISQKGREFMPTEVAIRRGDTINILNDDGDLRHHAYVDTDKFTFDSGDQEPGSKTSIKFPLVGKFDVLCAIHPKMKLVVKVQ